MWCIWLIKSIIFWFEINTWFYWLISTVQKTFMVICNWCWLVWTLYMEVFKIWRHLCVLLKWIKPLPPWREKKIPTLCRLFHVSGPSIVFVKGAFIHHVVLKEKTAVGLFYASHVRQLQGRECISKPAVSDRLSQSTTSRTLQSLVLLCPLVLIQTMTTKLMKACIVSYFSLTSWTPQLPIVMLQGTSFPKHSLRNLQSTLPEWLRFEFNFWNKTVFICGYVCHKRLITYVFCFDTNVFKAA